MTAVEFNYKLVGLQENLKYYAYTLTSNYNDAEDLLQETYVKAITNREKFTDNTNLKAWTFTIMKNTFINDYRKKVRNKTMLDNTDDKFLLDLSNESKVDLPDSVLSVKDIHERISSVDKEQRKPFEMYNAGYKYKEIAEKLDISIGTVKSRIYFTRKKLMDELKDY